MLTHWCRFEKTAAVLAVSMAIVQMQPAAGQAAASASACPARRGKQVGLKLLKQNGPVDTLVVDHIERLSEN